MNNNNNNNNNNSNNNIIPSAFSTNLSVHFFFFEYTREKIRKILKLKYHNRNNEWINNMNKESDELEDSLEATIHRDSLTATLKKVPNWKISGHDGIHGFWFKKFTPIHDRLGLQLSKSRQEASVSEWMTKGKTILIQDTQNVFTHVLGRIMTEKIREEIYYSLICQELFPKEQKECRCRIKGTKQLQYIDQNILKEAKTRRKMDPWHGLTTKRLMIWSRRLG